LTCLLVSRSTRRAPTSSLFPYTTLFRSREWYWQAEHGVRTGDFPHEYLGGFRLGKARIAPALPWKLLRCPARAILSSIDGRFALDRKSTRLNSSHQIISYAVFCLKKKKQ